jgi:glutamine amidotransferase
MTALDLRNGRMEKAEAERLVREYENKRPPSLDIFLEYLDITEEEFNGIVLNTVVPPHHPTSTRSHPARRPGISTSGTERNEIGARWNRQPRDGKPPVSFKCGGFVRHDHCIVESPDQLDALTHLILPGVGAFHTAMRRINEKSMFEPISDFVASGRPLLGLCVGMQLLGSRSEEGEDIVGLGLIPGEVRKFDSSRVEAIPHVGWNSVDVCGSHPVFKDVRTGVDFYFVHSFHLKPANDEAVLGVTDCGEKFVSVVARENVVGFQFHPEKSQANGLRLLDNFCGWDGRC